MYIGIDPGVTGGWAEISVDGSSIAYGHFKEGWVEIFEKFNTLVGHRVYLEKVSASPIMGCTRSFQFGANYGGWLALLEGLKISHTLVTPKTWQKELLGGFPSGQSKQRAFDFARRKWPNLNLKKSDDGIIDALCIAYYGRRENLNLKSKDDLALSA
jgi:hypothetical protein